jgi:hypothetical protein
MLLVTPISEDEIMFEDDGTRIALSPSPASSLTLARLSLSR